jgi:hypothetical protein
LKFWFSFDVPVPTRDQEWPHRAWVAGLHNSFATAIRYK